MTTAYVAGFAFDTLAETVLLVKKNRPKWQAGRLNAIGGHIEAGETPALAMVREFEEETGIKSEESDWEIIAVMTGPDWVVYFYKSFTLEIKGFKQKTDEEIVEININQLFIDDLHLHPSLYWLDTATATRISPKHIFNLSWLIPLCFDVGVKYPISVSYKQ